MESEQALAGLLALVLKSAKRSAGPSSQLFDRYMKANIPDVPSFYGTSSNFLDDYLKEMV